ncbi:hypothetical protein BVC80_1787g3 [Macleaya cordata]|uniref:Uncharacterized protein n=1 Tax=Macleaya cordata TaxID=56857 RepID=A0A200QTZ3_MACCD|nr:hypothetical protein BVC80_1787g3 [Macleaya cordata]
MSATNQSYIKDHNMKSYIQVADQASPDRNMKSTQVAAQASHDHNMKSIQESAHASSDRFRLMYLFSVMKMNDDHGPDLTNLAVGVDLTTLGLNLNSTDNLHESFGSPWSSDHERPAEGEPPEYTVPEWFAKQLVILHAKR